MFKDVLGSLGARFFGQDAGFTPIQPRRIQPIYFPAWFVDAELESSAWVSLDTEEGESEQVHQTVSSIVNGSL